MARAHGTPAKYAEGCTCDVCTDANTARNKVSQEKRADREPPRHDASTYRNWRCRCPVCTRAHQVENRARNAAVGQGAKHRQLWTDEDLKVALATKDSRRYQYTAAQAAVMLERTISGVNQQRFLAKVRSRTDTPAPGGK